MRPTCFLVLAALLAGCAPAPAAPPAPAAVPWPAAVVAAPRFALLAADAMVGTWGEARPGTSGPVDCGQARIYTFAPFASPKSTLRMDVGGQGDQEACTGGRFWGHVAYFLGPVTPGAGSATRAGTVQYFTMLEPATMRITAYRLAPGARAYQVLTLGPVGCR